MPSAATTSASTTPSISRSWQEPRCSRCTWYSSGPLDSSPVVPDTPLVNVKAQYERLIPQIKERIAAVLDSGTFILGPNVKAFEAEAAEHLGVARTVGVANGTDALVLALDAMGIGPGDEVICPALTSYATAE